MRTAGWSLLFYLFLKKTTEMCYGGNQALFIYAHINKV
jgi:hypothetical protein